MTMKEAREQNAWGVIDVAPEEALRILSIARDRMPGLLPGGISPSDGYGHVSDSDPLYFDKNILEVAASASWIGRQKRRKTFGLSCTSYGYKHYVEKWMREQGIELSIANGSFIAAALGLGMEVKAANRNGRKSPNVYLKLASR